MKTRLQSKTLTLVGVLMMTLLVVASLVAPGPSASTIRETELFCKTIDKSSSIADVMRRVAQSAEVGVKAHVVDEATVLIRLHTCHCWVSSLPSGTTVSDVVCNG